jgi:hypothetical protein
MVPELNGGEGVTFLVREAAPKLKEASAPAYGERGGVRCLGTDGVAKKQRQCGGVGSNGHRGGHARGGNFVRSLTLGW